MFSRSLFEESLSELRTLSMTSNLKTSFSKIAFSLKNSLSSGGISPVILAVRDRFFLLVSFQFSNCWIRESSSRFLSDVLSAAC